MEMLAGVPNLQDDLEYISVDLPWSSSQNVESRIDEFHIAQVRRLTKINLLFSGFLVSHHGDWWDAAQYKGLKSA